MSFGDPWLFHKQYLYFVMHFIVKTEMLVDRISICISLKNLFTLYDDFDIVAYNTLICIYNFGLSG